MNFSYIQPTGTPPNALAAGLANIRNKDIVGVLQMIRSDSESIMCSLFQALAGIGPSLITLITYWLSMDTWGRLIYPETTTSPDWPAPNLRP